MVVTFDVWENGGTGDSGDSQCARKSQVLQPTYCNKQLIGGLWTIVLKPDKLPILFITTQASWPARTSAQSRRPSKWRSRWPLKSNISFLRNIWTSLEPNDIQVQTQQPYQLRTYAWCWAIPPKCSRYKIQMKTVFKTEVVMTFLGSDSDGFLITTFWIRWFQRSEQSQRAAPASRSAPMEPLVFRSAGDFFSSDYQQLCDFVFFLTMLFIGPCWTLWSCSLKWSWSYLWCCSAPLFNELAAVRLNVGHENNLQLNWSEQHVIYILQWITNTSQMSHIERFRK